jgi:hypothetical protein
MQTYYGQSEGCIRLDSRFVYILLLNGLAAVHMRERDQATAIATVKRWKTSRQAGDMPESAGSPHMRCAAVIVLASGAQYG